MNEISRVLCVVDSTNTRHYALDRAAWICGKANATLELLVCYYNEFLSGQRLFDAPSLEEARNEVLKGHEQHLEELAGPLRNKGIDVVTKALWDRPLHEGIARYAAAINADLVVKDTNYHSTISAALLGNADWQLIRNCASPLWLVKPEQIQDHPVFLSAIDPMNEHDKPAALDDEIIVWTKALAKLCDGEVHAFHSYDPSIALASAASNAYLPVSLPYHEINEQAREEHGRRFHEITRYHGIDEANTHLVSGRTKERLPAIACKLDAAVVVMGAIARNQWRRLFIGATAEQTLDRLPCDVLIVKPDWFHTPEEILRHA